MSSVASAAVGRPCSPLLAQPYPKLCVSTAGPVNNQDHFVCCRIRVGDDLLTQDSRDSLLQSHISRRVPDSRMILGKVQQHFLIRHRRRARSNRGPSDAAPVPQPAGRATFQPASSSAHQLALFLVRFRSPIHSGPSQGDSVAPCGSGRGEPGSGAACTPAGSPVCRWSRNHESRNSRSSAKAARLIVGGPSDTWAQTSASVIQTGMAHRAALHRTRAHCTAPATSHTTLCNSGLAEPARPAALSTLVSAHGSAMFAASRKTM